MRLPAAPGATHGGMCRALASTAAFVFEGISSHLKPNMVSGKSYPGAVHYGHFYVYVDKIGSVKAWSNFKPFESYSVEGWWLDNEMKKGNLTRKET